VHALRRLAAASRRNAARHGARALLFFGLACWRPANVSAHPPLRASGAAWTTNGAALAARTNRGLIIASDRGAQLLCPMALGAFPNEQLPLVAASDGGWLVGTSQGVLHLDARGCRDPDGARLLASGVLDLVSASGGDVYAITADASAGSSLFRSGDSGQSFELVLQLPERQFFNSVVADPAGDGVYLAGERVDEQDQVAHFIGAVTAQGAALEAIELEPEESLVRVLAVEPAPAHVVVAGAFSSATSSQPSRLLRSDDAGRSWRTWQAVPGLQQVSFSADGETAWMSTDAGLWRSDTGGPFASLPLERAPSCVVPDGDLLVVCDALGLQGTRDGARSFEPLLRFADVTAPVSCDGSGYAVLECRNDWQEFSLEREQVFGSGTGAALPGPPGRPPASAGTAAPAPPESNGTRAASCSLRAGGGARAPVAGEPLALLALAAWASRRAARRR